MIRHSSCIAMLVVLCLALVSCKRESTNIDDIDLRNNQALAGSQDHLARAISTLRRAEQFDQTEARTKVISQLSQWIESQPPVDDWSVDPLIRTLPGLYGGVFEYAPLERMQFVGTDYHWLHEAVWMRQIVNEQLKQLRAKHPEPFFRIDDLSTSLQKLERESDELRQQLEEKATPDLQEKIEAIDQQQAKVRSELAAAEGELELLKTQWLFDWTTRNIRLLATNWDANLPGAEDGEEELTPPPGARYRAWQSLLLGQGDAVSRARVFILLCRQAGIDVVMLGVPAEDPKQAPREWAAGALVAGDVYLFDAELGIPIPGTDDTRPASYAELQANPELLRELDTEEFPYHFKAEDLESVVPLIDASLEALSQRMMLVEQSLSEEQQLVLTVSPGVVAKQLRKHGLSEARIWQAPYRGYLYDYARQQNPKTAATFYQEMAIFAPPMELYAARLHQFRGQIDDPNDDDTATRSGARQSQTPAQTSYRHGAKHYYLRCRNPDDEIDSIEQEIEAWFAQDRTRTRNDLMQQLRYDLYRLKLYQERRSDLKAGDIDPAEQFYRQQLEAAALEADPEVADEISRGQRELLPEEVEDLRQIEKRLSVLSPTTRDWIERFPPQLLQLDEDQRGDFLSQFKQVAATTREHATWWLAIATMEAGDLGVSANFLQQRNDESPNDVWGGHAHHQLGRVYELAGQNETAIEYYQADQSPQRAGSLVRARQLAQQTTSGP